MHLTEMVSFIYFIYLLKQKKKQWNIETIKTYLHNKIPSAEVGDGAGQPRASPDEPQEKRPLCVGEGLHHLPEPLDERRRRLHPLVRSN